MGERADRAAKVVFPAAIGAAMVEIANVSLIKSSKVHDMINQVALPTSLTLGAAVLLTVALGSRGITPVAASRQEAAPPSPASDQSPTTLDGPGQPA